MLVALFDSIGLTMFIPLLGKATTGNIDYSHQLGDLKILIDFMMDLGFNFTLGGVLLVIAILFTAKGITRYLEDFYRVRLRLIFMKSIRFKLLDQLSTMSYSHFTKSNSGEIQNNMTVEVNQVILGFDYYFKAAQGIMTATIYVSLAFIASPRFALLVLAAGLLSNLLYQRIYRYTKQASKEVSAKGHLFHSFLLQNVNYFKYLRATGGITKYKSKIKDKINDIENAQLRIGNLNAILYGSRETVATIVVVFVIFIQVRLLKGLITAMLLSLMFFYRALGSVLSVQNHWNLYLGVSGSVDSLKRFLADLQNNQEVSPGKSNAVAFDQIQLDDVSFHYKNGKNLLENISLTIKKGETIAIVGESGSGKTTLMNLISGLIEPSTGDLLIGTMPIGELDKKEWQKRLGYITQEPVVFDDTIANNVSFWDDKHSSEFEDRINKSLQLADSQDFVTNLDHGIQTPLGYNGVSLSGGQKQKISIARELYKDDLQLLLMDEATSSLDSESERLIYDHIKMNAGDRTTIIIAHRLASVRNADRILLMHKGKIEEEGTFEELQLKNDRFKEMVELQEF